MNKNLKRVFKTNARCPKCNQLLFTADEVPCGFICKSCQEYAYASDVDRLDANIKAYIRDYYQPYVNTGVAKTGCYIEVENEVSDSKIKRKGILYECLSKEETASLGCFGQCMRAYMFDTKQIEDFQYGWEVVKYPTKEDFEYEAEVSDNFRIVKFSER